MRSHTLLGAIGICAVVGTYLAATGDFQSPTVAPAKASQPADFGHLILQVEGDVTGLRVTRITPKKSGYNATRLKSPFTADLLDAAGRSLGSYPIDLSAFDLDPKRVGKPLRVAGCEVRDSKIATIVNVPWFATTARVQVRQGAKVLGDLGGAGFAKLIAEGTARMGEAR